MERTFDLRYKQLTSLLAPVVNILLKEDGVVVVGHECCRERLAEYFEILYNVPSRLIFWLVWAHMLWSTHKGRPILLPDGKEVVFINWRGWSTCWSMFGSCRAAQGGWR